MYRHSPTRNQRSKGFRLKHVLQICVLVAVCFWLVYQVKHSHDKRKQFDESNAKNSLNMEDNSVVVKLGRKDLIPLEKGKNKDSESHDGEVEDDNEEGNLEQDKHEEESSEEAKHEEETEEEDKPEEEENEENDRHEEATEKEEDRKEETGEEDRHEDATGEEDRHEDETNEKDNHEDENGTEDKHEEEEIQAEEKDEGRGDEDNEVNQHEPEKADTDVDGEDESLDEEKGKEDPIKEETEEKNDEDKDTLTKNDPSVEDHVHDEGSRNTREAREEQYKGDDASSAVTHDAQSISTENENGSSGSQLNILEHEGKGNSTEENKNATVVTLPEVETAGNGTLSLNEENMPEVYDSVSQSNSSPDSITGLESNDQQGSINNTDKNGSSVKNEMEIIISDPSHSHDATEGDITTTDDSNIQGVSLDRATNTTVTLQNTQVNSNLLNSNVTKTVEGNSEESANSSTKSEFDNRKNVEGSNVLAESKDGSDSLVLEETTNEVKNENPDNFKGTDETYEKSDSSNTENTDEAQYDSTDTSDPSVAMDDKESRIDLDTLPETRTEGSNSEEVAED